MKIHEYQAKTLLAAYGVPVPEQALALTPGEALLAAQGFGGRCVVKAQAHTGGRGKAGGVKLAQTAEQAEAIAQNLLGKQLVTHQSGPAGCPVDRVLVTACADIESEYYVAITLNTAAACPEFILSAAGGMEIEALAKEHPEQIHRVPVAPETSFCAYHGYEAARLLGLSGPRKKALVSLLGGLYRLFTEKDCALIELNPLAALKGGGLSVLDAKISFDDNALFLHPELEALRDPGQEDPREAEAKQASISYVALGGSIGCLVNGAGLAMATMDLIQSRGAKPANFLDVGGSATPQKVAKAFSLLLAEPGIKAILVNIFGGIMRCDVIAEGIVQAVGQTGLAVPLVVRLQGANVEEGRRILAASGLPVVQAEGFGEAVEKAVAAAGGESA